jgi:hypothetical protein
MPSPSAIGHTSQFDLAIGRSNKRVSDRDNDSEPIQPASFGKGAEKEGAAGSKRRNTRTVTQSNAVALRP